MLFPKRLVGAGAEDAAAVSDDLLMPKRPPADDVGVLAKGFAEAFVAVVGDARL